MDTLVKQRRRRYFVLSAIINFVYITFEKTNRSLSQRKKTVLCLLDLYNRVSISENKQTDLLRLSELDITGNV